MNGGAAVAQLFTEDGFVLSGGRPPIRGRTAIAEHYGSGGGGPLSLRALAFAADGSLNDPELNEMKLSTAGLLSPEESKLPTGVPRVPRRHWRRARCWPA